MPRPLAIVRDPRRQAGRVARALAALFPEPACALIHRDAFELLAATILSAQCTDARVNLVTPALFARFPDPASLASADPAEVEALIRPTGFFRAKARNLIAMASALMDRHAGAVPADLDALTALPGVVVDTHVKRLAYRLGMTDQTDPVRIERVLNAALPKKHWIELSHRLILHGRATCRARRPACACCALAKLCPRIGVDADSTRPDDAAAVVAAEIG